MLYYLLISLHVLVSFILILVVLLQTGKGADLAGAFGGGGSQTAFGSRGAATFLTKMTTTAAVVFMLTSFGLAILSSRGSASILEQTGIPEATQAGPAASGTADDAAGGAVEVETDSSDGDVFSGATDLAPENDAESGVPADADPDTAEPPPGGETGSGG